MMQYLTSGADLAAIALLINRIALGAFFTISGFHKLFNRQRHAAFVRELVVDRVPRLGFNQWFVPSVEFSGGLALLTGMLAPLAALGLLVICLVAVHTSGKRRVACRSTGLTMWVTCCISPKSFIWSCWWWLCWRDRGRSGSIVSYWARYEGSV